MILFIVGCVPAHAEQASFQRTIARVQHLKECNAGVYYPAARVRAELALPLSNDDLAGDDSITNCLRVSFIFPSLSTQGYALYLLHVSPGAGVWLNGSYIGASEDFRSATSDGWNYPLLFSLPAALLREGSNELLIQIGPWNRFNRPLDAITIGPERLLRPRFQHQVWVQATGVEIVSTLVGLIGLFAAVLWWNRRSDVIFGLFALSCALWIIRNSKFFLRHFYVPHLYFEIITDVSVYWLAAVLFALSFRISNTRFPRLEAGLVQAASLVTLVMCLLSSQAAWIYSVATGLLIPMSVVYFVFLTWLVSRQGTVLLWLLWLAAVVTTAFGTYDFMLQFGYVSRPGAYLMPYSALFYAVTVGWALIDRFVNAHNSFERLTIELDARLQSRERELALRYAQMAALERDKVIALERERILRDMHDGLGMQLISSMRLIEKGEVTREQTSALLAEALDELRIAIDSVKPTARDLLLMLGNLRYRLEPRLAAAGISLDWEVGEVAGIDDLAPQQITEITRIVQEAFANAMKHSRATHMVLRVSSEDGVRVTVTDNGIGFDVALVRRGEGLKNMQARAVRIGATATIASRPGETRIELHLPRALVKP